MLNGEKGMRVKPKRKDAIDRLYDSFAVKDMTRADFRKQYEALMNPQGIRRDLTTMVLDRQMKKTLDFVAQQKRKEIDNVVSNTR